MAAEEAEEELAVAAEGLSPARGSAKRSGVETECDYDGDSTRTTRPADEETGQASIEPSQDKQHSSSLAAEPYISDSAGTPREHHKRKKHKKDKKIKREKKSKKKDKKRKKDRKNKWRERHHDSLPYGREWSREAEETGAEVASSGEAIAVVHQHGVGAASLAQPEVHGPATEEEKKDEERNHRAHEDPLSSPLVDEQALPSTTTHEQTTPLLALPPPSDFAETAVSSKKHSKHKSKKKKKNRHKLEKREKKHGDVEKASELEGKPEEDDGMADFIEHDGGTEEDDDVIRVKGGIDSENDRSDIDDEPNTSSYFEGVLESMRSRKKRKPKVSESELQMHVAAVLQKMREAAEYDTKSLADGQPATAKLMLVDQVVEEMSKPKFVQWFVQEGACIVLAEWLCPLDDGTLPNLTVRTKLLKLLTKMPIASEDLRGNELGRQLVQMWHRSDETEDNRAVIRMLVTQWMRPLMGASSDYKDNQQRQALEQEEAIEGSSQNLPPTLLAASSRVDLDELDVDNKRRRAFPPTSLGYNFTIQPKSDLSSHPNSQTRGPEGRRLPTEANRVFSGPRKAQKVSIEGRGMYQ